MGPTGVVQLRQTIYSISGIPMATSIDHRVRYDYVLDKDHQRAIEEARKLAGSLCLGLEIIDSGKQGLFGRLWSSFSRGGAGNPTIEVSPPSMAMATNSSPDLPRP